MSEDASVDNDQVNDNGDITEKQNGPEPTPTQSCPTVETQLEELRPLLDARLQENDIW